MNKLKKNRMKKKHSVSAIICLLCVFFLLSGFIEKERKITVFTIGDSTMATNRKPESSRERGWGQMLPGYFSEDVIVENHARGGRSSKSFIDEGRWDTVLSRMKKGDYVFIQFGHNDEKESEKLHTDPGSTFDANLKRFVNETRAKGAHPVLFNSIVRRFFSGDTLVNTHGTYIDAPRHVAKELDVPFVDMNKLTHELVESMGPEKSKELYMWTLPPKADGKGRKDNTHFNVHGARVMAGIAADAVADLIPKLGKYVRHYDWVVAKDGSGDFFTTAQAVEAVAQSKKSSVSILVRPGAYEKVNDKGIHTKIHWTIQKEDK